MRDTEDGSFVVAVVLERGELRAEGSGGSELVKHEERSDVSDLKQAEEGKRGEDGRMSSHREQSRRRKLLRFRVGSREASKRKESEKEVELQLGRS